MKTYNPLLTTLMAAILALASMPAISQADNIAARAGIVKIVNGDVRVRNAQGERPLKSGDVVFAKDVLIAGKQSSGSVVLRDSTTLIINDNAQLHLQQYAFNATTQEGNILVELLQGSMRMLTGLIAKTNPNAINVKTKTVSVGIRGTDFIVETEEKI